VFGQGPITILINIDVECLFFAAFCSKILHTIKIFNCRIKLYKVTRIYFSDRTSALHTNSIQIEEDITKGCPQASCCVPGYWKLKFKPLLNLKCGKLTKALAIAADLIIELRREPSKKPKICKHRNKQNNNLGKRN